MPLLHKRILELGIPATAFKLYAGEYTSSDQDPTVLWLDYQPVVEITNAYTLPQVKIEIGVRAMMEPLENRKVMSLLSAFLEPDDFGYVPSVLPQRTFWEKSFLLHELFQKPLEKINTLRMSRHWYDLDRLDAGGFAEKAMADEKLFHAIRNHRKTFTKVAGVDYDALSPKAFGLFPPKEKLSEWMADYGKMTETYIYKDTPTLDALSSSITKLTRAMKMLSY